MGLDGVELVMAVEDAFDIQIDDAQAATLVTPRLLIDYVLGKVATATTTVCLTHRSFNLLRKSLLHQGVWKRSEIRPTTKLAVLVPKNCRRKFLLKVSAELRIKKSPALVRPKWLTAVLFAAAVLCGFWVAALAFPFLTTLAILVFTFAAFGIGAIGASLTNPLRSEFPAELETIGDLARWLMTHMGDLADATRPAWTREQITTRVREIIVEQLGVKPDFSDDAHFVKDLGLD